LTEEVLKTMWLSKFKILAALVGGFALVLGLTTSSGRTPAQPALGKSPVANEQPAAGKPAWRARVTFKHEQPVTLVACGADWSAAGDEGGNLFLWDTRTGTNRKRVLQGQKGGKGRLATTSVDHLQFTPEGQFLYAVLSGRRGLFRVELKGDQPGHGVMADEPSYLGVSPDGETWVELYGAGRTLTLRPNVYTRGAVDYETIAYEAKVTHAVVSLDGKQLGVVTADGNLHLHELPSRHKTQTIAVAVKDRTVKAVAFSPDGKRVAVVADDVVGTIYETASGREVATLKGHRGIIFTVAFSPDGKTVLTGGDDNTLRLWDTATGKARAVLEGHTDSVVTVAFAPDGRRLVSGSADRTVKVWVPTK
jgi:WD40 repeat protein